MDATTSKNSEIRVLIVYPTNKVVEKKKFDNLTSALLRAIALKKWKSVANIVFRHDNITEHIPDALRRKIKQEFRSLSSDCLLKGISPKEITTFSNENFLEELRVKSPLWYSVVNGACGMLCNPAEAKRKRACNVIAVATSLLARFRNPKLSAVAYRVSMILLHGGLSYVDIKRLNHLGICMSPDSIVELQRKMGASSDAKVQIWKKSIEDILTAKYLVTEIIQRQFQEDKDVTETADLNEEVIKGYTYYTKRTYQFCVQLINGFRLSKHEDHISLASINDALQHLQSQRLARFR